MGNLQELVAGLIAKAKYPEDINWVNLSLSEKLNCMKAIKYDDFHDLDDLPCDIIEDEHFKEAVCRYLLEESEQLLYDVLTKAVEQHSVFINRFEEELETQLRGVAA